MGIGKKIKEKLTGKNIKEYDVIEQVYLGVGKMKYHVTLKEIDNKPWVIITVTSGLVSRFWIELDMDNVQKLRDDLDDALNTSFTKPSA